MGTLTYCDWCDAELCRGGSNWVKCYLMDRKIEDTVCNDCHASYKDEVKSLITGESPTECVTSGLPQTRKVIRGKGFFNKLVEVIKK